MESPLQRVDPKMRWYRDNKDSAEYKLIMSISARKYYLKNRDKIKAKSLDNYYKKTGFKVPLQEDPLRFS